MKSSKNLALLTCILFATCSFTIDANELPEPYKSVEIMSENPFGYYCNRYEFEKIFSDHDIKTVIEIGSWIGGGSTRHIASLLKPKRGKLYAIDTWLGSIEHQEGNGCYNPVLPVVYEQFLSNMIHWDFTSIVVPMRMKSTEAAKILNVNPDLIYIDGDHTTEAVLEDLNHWYPLAGPNCIVCGDDWSWETVRIAVIQFARENDKKIYASGNFWRLLNK